MEIIWDLTEGITRHFYNVYHELRSKWQICIHLPLLIFFYW